MRRAITSKIWKLTSDFGLLNFDFWHPTSNIQHPTFDIPQATSHIRRLISYVRYPTSDVWYLTSDIWHLTSDVRHSTFDIRHSTFDIRHSTFDIRHSTFDIRHSTYDIRHPISDVSLEFKIFRLTYVVSRNLTLAVWTFDIAHLRLMIIFFLIAFIVYRWNKFRQKKQVLRDQDSGWMRISCACIVWWKIKWSQQEMEVLRHRCLDRRCFWSWSVRQRQEFNMLQKLQFVVKDHKIICAEWNKIQGVIAWIIIKLDERNARPIWNYVYDCSLNSTTPGPITNWSCPFWN